MNYIFNISGARRIIALFTALITLSACGVIPNGTSIVSTKNVAVYETEDVWSGSIEVLPAGNAPEPELSAARKDRITVASSDVTGDFSPLFASGEDEELLYSLMYGFLIGYSMDGTPEPELAEWSRSADGLTYTFTLYEAYFENGDPVTAEDIAFAYHTVLHPDFDGVWDISPSSIVGAEEYRAGKALSIRGIRVRDRKTLDITLERPSASALYYLNVPALSKAYIEGFGGEMVENARMAAESPLCSGAYRLAEFNPGESVILVRNEYYAGGTPTVREICFLLVDNGGELDSLLSGETDAVRIEATAENIERLASSGFIRSVIYPSGDYAIIGINHKNELLADRIVREAISLCVDRVEIQALYGGYAHAARAPFSPASWAYGEEMDSTWAYAPEKAAELLDGAGWKPGTDGVRVKNGKRLSLSFAAIEGHAVTKSLLPKLQTDLREIGIELRIEEMELAPLLEKILNGEAELCFFAWGLSEDPSAVESLYASGMSQNIFYYSNKETDELFALARQTEGMEERRAIYRRITELLRMDTADIPLYCRAEIWAFSSGLGELTHSQYRPWTIDISQIKLSR